MILPVFGYFLPNNGQFDNKNIPADFKNEQTSIVKRCTASKLTGFTGYFEILKTAEKRQILTKCIVFNQWFCNRADIGVCLQTIENGTVMLEDLS